MMGATKPNSFRPSRRRVLCMYNCYNSVNTAKSGRSVTAVGGTIFVPETAVSFSGAGFSNVVSVTRSCYLEAY